jgi:hypothetical protein
MLCRKSTKVEQELFAGEEGGSERRIESVHNRIHKEREDGVRHGRVYAIKSTRTIPKKKRANKFVRPFTRQKNL